MLSIAEIIYGRWYDERMDMQRHWDDTDSGKLKQCYSDHRTSHTDGPGIEPAVKGRQQEGGLMWAYKSGRKGEEEKALHSEYWLPCTVIVTAPGIRRVATISIAPNTKLITAKLVDNRNQITGERGHQFQDGLGYNTERNWIQKSKRWLVT